MRALSAVVFTEDGVGNRIWPTTEMTILPSVGDVVETAVDVLDEGQSRAFATPRRGVMVGTVTARRFINRGGSWVCVLTVQQGAVQEASCDDGE